MNEKQVQSVQRRIFRTFKSWKDPHTDVALADTQQIQGIEISPDGEVQLAITPQRPHCPCCLFDLRDLREKIAATKGRDIKSKISNLGRNKEFHINDYRLTQITFSLR